MDSKYRILVVDDEEKIIDVLKAYLKQYNYAVFTAKSGSEALDVFKVNTPQIIILDLMLPDIPGEEVCRMIRQTSNVPIIILTAKTHESSILNGFDFGADDYVTKPFSVKQLMARVKALLKRTYMDDDEQIDKNDYEDGYLTIGFSNKEVKVNNQPIAVTPKEFKILSALIKHKKKIFKREELITLIYDQEYDGYDRTIDAHIKNLRKKIEQNSGNVKYIQTVYGVGYKFGGS